MRREEKGTETSVPRCLSKKQKLLLTCPQVAKRWRFSCPNISRPCSLWPATGPFNPLVHWDRNRSPDAPPSPHSPESPLPWKLLSKMQTQSHLSKLQSPSIARSVLRIITQIPCWLHHSCPISRLCLPHFQKVSLNSLPGNFDSSPLPLGLCSRRSLC